ncbi:hypothetical protein V7114_24430 [Neobacillus niacini]|uniref:hypothetical protein n=1 Tax=Neobacillus niacini TaxID=86668 RepID=UPI003000F292
MQTIIWAFGSMLLLLLIISFLPLGFNLRGKFIVIFSAFTIAMAGLAAVNVFPILQTLLILLVLTFIGAYILDSRLGKVIYQEFLVDEEEMTEEIKLPFSKQQSEKKSEFDLLELEEIKAVTPSAIKISANFSPSEPETIPSIDENLEILFLQDNKTDQIEFEETSEIEITDGYLADIENLLLEETEVEVESMEDDWLSELADLEEMEAKKNTNKEENQLDAAELEILFAFKEAAASEIEPLELESLNKKVVLEK